MLISKMESSMKNITAGIIGIIIASGLSAQEKPKAEGHVWIDAFGGNQGLTVYPQYGWKLPTSLGGLSGYGFPVEITAHEQGFLNNLVIFTPGKQNMFSIHTETGAVPMLHLGFHQIGPRVNVHEVIPKAKKVMDYTFVTVLPRFIGIRPNNLLIAGSTKKFKVRKDVRAFIEGYRRFFPGGRPDYAEYWMMIEPEQTKPFSFGAFIVHDGEKVSVNFGVRLTVR